MSLWKQSSLKSRTKGQTVLKPIKEIRFPTKIFTYCLGYINLNIHIHIFTEKMGRPGKF